MKNNLAAMAFAACIYPALAMAQQSPIRSATTMVQPQAMQIVTGAPTKMPEAQKDDGPKLKYWDGSKPLTIGDMSEMQRKTLTDEFLLKHGYTTKEPSKPVVQPKAKLPPPTPHSMKVQAVYGPQSSPTVDLILDGKFVTAKSGSEVKSGTLVFGIKRAKRGHGVLLDIPARLKEACKGKASKRGKCKSMPAASVTVLGGDSMEFPR